MNWLSSEQIHFLPLASINPADTTFSLVPAWSTDGRPLAQDGPPCFVTPLVGQQTPLGLRIVTGFRLFQSAQQWSLDRVPFLLADPQFPVAELFKLVIIEARGSRDLNLLELATIVGKFVDQWSHPQEQVLQTVLPLLGLPPQRHHLRRLLRLSRLSQALQQGLDVVEEEILLGLATWTETEQSFLWDRLLGMRLGRNKQRLFWQLLNELRDLRGRQEEWLGQVWEESGAFQVEQSDVLSPADRFERIWQGLRRIRYPGLSALEARQAQLTRALALPPPVRLSLPRFFEGDQIEFHFKAKSPEQCQELLDRLSEAAQSPEMAQLFELL